MRFAVAALALLGLAAPASAAPASAPPDRLRQPPTQAGGLAAEAAWASALAGRDLATLDRLLAPDFVDTGWQGARRDKASYLAAIGAAGAQPVALSDLTVGLYGAAAGVRGRNTVRGREGAVRARVRFTDVFVYRAGAWQAVAAQETVEQR